MRAILISEPGDPDVLTPGEAPDPTAGPGEVVLDVVAAGVNRADVNQRQGHYPPPPGAPEWPGLEVSGTIADPGDTAFARGDRVCALLAGGGYAERVAVDARLVLPVPDGVDLVEAAGLPEAAATVWSNVFQSAQLQPGETLLVHGGSSGIGTMAIQIATALGSRVLATAGSAAKVAFCESLGATAVDYHEADFVEKAQELGGADVVLDLVGGDYLERNIAALRTGGRIMVIANQSNAASTFQLGALMAKRGRVWGTTLRSRPVAKKAEVIRGLREYVWPLVEQGVVRPIIDTVFSLDEAALAHRRMEEGGHVGKLLLRV
ncbi:putative PIG3 family NAD(P)H quinone oxidoreductase [Frondihabitans sp. PhB188]|uniref:NAD(P)H-quinone oxidoreductase n=1 Tax=Frondihabitans sp. PhB188 TaxID=2485200 RepID=UPI000F4AC298|nr:NAD(P)H-quinone oxidoreductase [Frondihabitans sp. PhB188]ROQ39989.1 putative PIG3 family NAD(P)H quinone oxidoreductase [Frondihabitans sp. PhB188]